MFIPEFLCGVVATIILETAAVIIAAVTKFGKEKDNEKS